MEVKCVYPDPKERSSVLAYLQVKSVKRYRTLEGYLRGESLRKTLPGIHSTQQAVKIYNKWSSPSQRNSLRSKYGYSMLAIRV